MESERKTTLLVQRGGTLLASERASFRYAIVFGPIALIYELYFKRR